VWWIFFTLCEINEGEKMNSIRYAIVGFGGIAENRIAKEGFALDNNRFESIPGIKLVGATDVSPARQNAVENLGLKWYNNSDDIGNDSDIDAVFIATNNLSHFPLAEKLIKAKKHLIIEKPMATTLENAKNLVKLATENRISLAVDHMMLYNVYNIKANELIEEGKIGDVNDVVLHMEFPYGYTAEEAAQWRNADPDEVGGPIGDVACHCMYMAEFLLKDKITSIKAIYTPEVNKLKVENGAFIRFKTKNNITGSVRVSFSDLRGALQSIFLNLGYEIYGDKGTIRTFGTLFQLSGHKDEPINLRLEVDDFERIENIKIPDVKNIYQEVIKHHADSVRTGKLLTGAEALHNLELVLKAHQSAKHNGQEQIITSID
jgi:predicted dehydrogenase